MSASQIHLALTHVPVVLSIAGLAILIVGLIGKNAILTKTAFSLLLISGLFTIPVYLTGEGAEEIVERLPGVSKTIIEQHEDMGKNAFTLALLVALLAMAALLFYYKTSLIRILKPLVLLAAIASAGVMTWTAHLGGQVRHTELRPQSTITQETEKKPAPTNEATEDE